jgi:endonuclease/exonuclease/phosphatase family metal-dependent hydrolase
VLAALLPVVHGAEVLAPRVSTTNAHIRIMAANLTGNSQSYEDFALRIFQGLKPDVVAIQEFNFLGNSAAELRAMVNTAFGTGFSYFRESGYSIPNGIISRWPIRAAGSWEDTDPGVNDRGFAWARLDIPGTNDLFVVSVHLKASSGSENVTRRAAQATALKALVEEQLPSNVWIIVAGDCNIRDPGEPALATFKNYLSDTPIPTDAPSGGDADTNSGRTERYDYVFPNFGFATNRIPTVIGSATFPNGLVFDSTKYKPLGDVTPVQSTDSTNAQHMAVLKDFRVSYSVTNFVPVPAPVLSLVSTNILRWSGLSNLSYTVQTSRVPENWQVAGSASSTTTNIVFTNSPAPPGQNFYRVLYP